MTGRLKAYGATGSLFALSFCLCQILGLMADRWFTVIHYIQSSQDRPIPPLTRLVQMLHVPFASSLTGCLITLWLLFLLACICKGRKKDRLVSSSLFALILWSQAACLAIMSVGLFFWSAALLVLIPTNHPIGVGASSEVAGKLLPPVVRMGNWGLLLLCASLLVHSWTRGRIRPTDSSRPGND